MQESRFAGSLEAFHLSRSFRGRRVVDNVSLVVRPGEIVGLLGPNGAGKTVTFSIIVGLLKPHGGRIVLDDVDITRLATHKRARRGLVYLPQERSLFHGLTAEDNVAGVLECRGFDRTRARQRAKEILRQLGIRHLAPISPARLSGGEQRRVEVARSLALEPRFLLFDEPFAGVDPLVVESLHRILLDLRSQGIGILITDHNVREALSLCDRAYVLFNGRVLAQGTSNELITSEDVRRHFLGETFARAGGAATSEHSGKGGTGLVAMSAGGAAR
jgi:lipopolysaccharide export system ATP-binding protein